jgi:membrane-bound serine protease (ClpP class)
MLFRNAPAPYHTSVPLVAAVAGSLGAFWAIAIGKAIQVRRRPVSVGPQDVLGSEAEVRREGLVFVRGELWQALDADGEPLRPGERVRVEGIDGLTLRVRHVHEPAAVS